jgi:predicted AAA+ superfamily ATPase
MHFVKRHIEEILERVSKSFAAILVTGPRQVGKTTLLTEFKPEIKHILMEKDSKNYVEADSDPEYFLNKFPSPVIFDEIQNLNESFLPALKLCIDTKKEKGMYYLTGSQQFPLMKRVSESLAGRVSIIELNTLSLREISGSDHNIPFLYDDKNVETNKNGKIDEQEL